MLSVHSGTKSLKKQETKGHLALLPMFLERSGTFILLYVKASIMTPTTLSTSTESFSNFHRGDDDPLEHAVNLNIFGRGPRTYRHSTFSQVASDRQRLCEAVSGRDVCCVVTGYERAVCQASHITPFASEDAVSLLPIYHTAHLRLPVNPVDCDQPPKLR